MKEISVKKTVFYAQGAMGSGTFAPLCFLFAQLVSAILQLRRSNNGMCAHKVSDTL